MATTKSDQTKEQIIKAACDLFAKHGYASVSTRMIAEKVGLRHGTVHYHFKSKEALYTEIFRSIFEVDNMLTYEVLLEKEPVVLETPSGKAYAVQRVVSDYFHRHLYIGEEWKRRLILRELFDSSPIYLKLVEDILRIEAEKMTEFYYLLNPGGSESDAFVWAHMPDTQALYYLMAESVIEAFKGREFVEELGRNVIKTTVRNMVGMLNLPVPEMLKQG